MTNAARRKDGGHVRAVFLVGFMGAGKTSVGRALSHRLGWSYEDLDDRIQIRAKRSVAEIFHDSGEEEFRRLEHSALREILVELDSTPRVVALGGGAFAQAENLRLLEAPEIYTIFLDAPVEELFQRCERERRERPLARDLDKFRELYEQRRPFYLRARICVNTNGRDVDTVAAEVACSLEL